MRGSVDEVVMRLLAVCAMSASPVIAAQELELPPLGFFDYLGSMVEHEGELIDPLSLEPPQADQGAEVEPGNETANKAEEVQ